ncbi:MAG: hypothetical protein M1813_003567 [Trichoglossum hirsutum]|nr:MAG: hypothetical protein M1813_003567 [Trichoglossum hirsutum]
MNPPTPTANGFEMGVKRPRSPAAVVASMDEYHPARSTFAAIDVAEGDKRQVGQILPNPQERPRNAPARALLGLPPSTSFERTSTLHYPATSVPSPNAMSPSSAVINSPPQE